MFHYSHQVPYSVSVFENVRHFGSRAAVDVSSWSPWVTEIILPVIIAGIGLAVQYCIFKSIAYAVTRDGKTVPLAADLDRNLHTRESYAPAAEDNLNGVIAIQHRPLAVGSYSKRLYNNLGKISGECIKKSSGNLYSVDCSNMSSCTLFFQIHNKAELPKDGDEPFLSLRVLPGSDRSAGENILGSGGLHLFAGITFAISSKSEVYSPVIDCNSLVNIVYF